MKIRAGFVSNSSSSSFLMYGIFVKSGDFDDVKINREDEDDYDEYDDSLYDKLETLTEGTPLGYYYPEGYGGAFIGLSWDSVGGEETGNQFKARVESLT